MKNLNVENFHIVDIDNTQLNKPEVVKAKKYNGCCQEAIKTLLKADISKKEDISLKLTELQARVQHMMKL